jgi:hypothetical protein
MANEDICLACKAGFHDECADMWNGNLADSEDCCCQGAYSLEPSTAYEAALSADKPDIDAYFDGYTGSKSLDQYADPISTGRKEAVKKFPIKPGMVCEWAWLKNAGGGVKPIIGCPGHPAEAVHHGPDKNTMCNIEGNVHRICAECHNRWHATNDPFYGERPTTPDGKVDASVPFLPIDQDALPHDPDTFATDEMIHAEDKKRRDEARRHGTLPKVLED